LLLSPHGEGVVLHMYNSESPLPKDDLYQLWLKLAQRFWRRSRKCKSLTDRRQTDGDRRTMDNGRSEKLTSAFSSSELKSQSTVHCYCDIVLAAMFSFFFIYSFEISVKFAFIFTGCRSLVVVLSLSKR
jgi:hypothetical protein